MNGKLKYTWFLTIFFLIAFNTMTVFGSENEYETVARNFLKYIKSDKEIVETRIIKDNALDNSLSGIDIGFLANLENGGYILISISKRLTPVKAYSLKGNFDTLPPAYKRFLTGEAEYNVRTLATTGRTPQSTTDQENIERWNFLLNLQQYRTPLIYTPDTHLLTTTWNQDSPYNKFLPEVNGEKVVAGCVNIAMGQLMKYYGYPSAGKGVAYHEWNGEQLKAILYRPYNWANIPDALNSTVPDYKVDEVARLIRDLAIANYTDLSTDNSGASANISALIDNFGFSTGIMEINNTDNVTLFFSTLKDEIDAERPVLLLLPGHMAVADGYASDEAGKKIHLNLGWGGHDDDYYFLDQHIITDSYDFSPVLEIYYNIKPCDGGGCSVNLEAEDVQDGLNINGKFDYERDADRYNVYLKGNTTITGTIEGYSNQAFYISVYDSNNVRLFSSNDTVSGTFATGRYTIRVSLYGEGGGFYSYDINHDNYTVSIVTDTLTDTEKNTVDAGLDKPPVIFNDFVDISNLQRIN